MKAFADVDVLQTVDRVTTDADSRRLAEAEFGQLTDGFVGQRAGARNDADAAFLVDVARHDADLHFVRGDETRAVRAEQQGLLAALGFFSFILLRTISMSRTGMPSVMQMARSRSASTASR